MKRHPVLWFYVLAFAISWLGWLPMVAASQGIALFKHPLFQFFLVLPAAGPTLAALMVARADLGKAGAAAWFRSLWRWPVPWWWLLVVIVLPALLLLAQKAVTQMLGLPAMMEPLAPSGESKLGMLMAGLTVALLANPWEEVGWRGFALPRLQRNHSALVATLTVGALWALWHLPLFFWADNPMSRRPFLLWFIGTVGDAFIYTWLFNSTRGSVLGVAIYHVLTNTYGAAITGVSALGGSIVSVAVALLLIALFGREHLARGERIRGLSSLPHRQP